MIKKQGMLCPYSSGSSQRGLSLIELAVIMIIVSLALAPIVRQIGGARNNTAGSLTQGNTADRIVAQKAKEVLLANTLIDKTLATDYSAFNCGGSFDPKHPTNGFPAPGQPKNFPASTRCVSNNYKQPLYYQWSMRNLDPTGQAMPVGNHYYSAVLNVWGTPTGGTPLLTLPTSFYWNDSSVINTQGKTGIMVALDQSASMACGQVRDTVNGGRQWSAGIPLGIMKLCKQARYPASPFLRARGLNIYDNNQLDVTTFGNADDPSTGWQDMFMRSGMLGVLDCYSTANWNNSNWSMFDFGGYPNADKNYNNYRDVVRNLCNVGVWYGQGSPQWTSTLNKYLSREEVARSTLISFLLTIEKNSDLYNNTKIGFLTYSSNINIRVYPENADTNGKFPNLRRKFTWINRGNGGPSAVGTNDGPINPDADTDLYGGVYNAASVLFQDPTLSSRIIVVLGDGRPQCAPTCEPGYATWCRTAHSEFQALGNAIGGGWGPYANGNKATIMSMGIMSDHPDMPAYLGDDLAYRTPGGFYNRATTMAEVKPVFDQIQYQIQRIILLNKVGRYNVRFD